MAQFDRIYRLTVGVQGKQGIVLEGKPKGNGLNIKFRIVKDLTTKSNKSTIEIINLSKDTSRKIEKEDSICILEVGYSEDIGLRRIFVGYITTAVTGIQNGERVTRLTLSDGQIPIRDCVVSLSYADNVSRKKIIDDIGSAMGLVVKYAEDVTFTELANGFSFIGAGRTCLDKACAGSGLSWSIQNNVLQVINNGGTTSVKGIKLSPSTGLVGCVHKIVKAPKKTTGKSAKKSKTTANKERKAGWKLSCLLQPTLNPADLIYIDSNEISGWYKIETIRHSGEYMGRGWYSELEVYEIG